MSISQNVRGTQQNYRLRCCNRNFVYYPDYMPNEITDSLVDIKDIEGYESLSPQEKVARVLLRLAEVRTDVRLKICALIQILPQVEDLALEPIDEIVIQTLLQAAREDEVITLQVVRAIVATILTQNNFITEALENTTDRIPTAEDILRSRTPNNTRLYDAFFAWLRKKNLTQVSVANALSIP